MLLGELGGWRLTVGLDGFFFGLLLVGCGWMDK